jgi:hypothetical protein
MRTPSSRPLHQPVGEPCAGEPHARIDATAGGTSTSRPRRACERFPPTRPLAGRQARDEVACAVNITCRLAAVEDFMGARAGSGACV